MGVSVTTFIWYYGSGVNPGSTRVTKRGQPGFNLGYKAGSILLRSRVDPGLTEVQSELRWRNESVERQRNISLVGLRGEDSIQLLFLGLT